MFFYEVSIRTKPDTCCVHSLHRSAKSSALFASFYFSLISVWRQLDSTASNHLSKKQKTNRQIFIGAVNVVGYGGSLIILSNTWYKNYPHTSFHTFNDAGEWLQVDKFGHGWTAYNTGRVSAAMWRWAGLSQKQSAIIGGLSGAVYLTVIEFLDAHSAQWGWSWGDMTANIVGSGLFISQELLWKEQRIQYKFSFHHKDYGDSALNKRADDLFGESWYETDVERLQCTDILVQRQLKIIFSRKQFTKVVKCFGWLWCGWNAGWF